MYAATNPAVFLNQTSTPEQEKEPQLTLKPVRIEWLSPKIQMLLAGIIGFLVCIFSYADALQAGFLLDDYLHLDYLSRAAHGDWHDFLHNFYGNWANSPVMQSFRPLVSLDLFLDYLAFGKNPWGYHLVNLLLLWACTIPLGLISLELSGLRGNRLSGVAALWAVLLFSVYPLHLEAAAWIIGRVDLLCAFFYLTSVFCYLRFRLVREKYLFYLALVSFAAAFFSKEMAVTLPAVITAAEFLLFPLFKENTNPEYAARRKTWRMVTVLSFWAVFGILFTLRTCALSGTVIGGYGSGHNPGLSEILTRFSNRDSIDRILFPVNLDILSRLGEWDLKDTLTKILKGAYIVLLSSALVRAAMQSISWRIVGFLAFWVLIVLAPTFQIWQISPNLVGSRLFFLPSAPLAILLAFLALPAIDAIKAKPAKVLSCAGSLALIVIVSVWSFWLQVDLKAWTGAAAVLNTFKTQAVQNITEAQGKVLFLNLPRDYSGAGMLSRGDYLGFLLKANGYDSMVNRAIVLEPKDGETQFNYSEALAKATQDNSIARILNWNDPKGIDEHGSLSVWTAPKDAGSTADIDVLGGQIQSFTDKDEGNFLQLVAANLQKPEPSKTSEWSVEKDGRSIRISEKGIRIKPGKNSLSLIFKVPELSTLKAKQLLIQCRSLSGGNQSAELLWSAQGTDAARIGFSSLSIEIPANSSEAQTIQLGLNKDWALSGKVNWIGLYFPKGDYEVELSGLKLQ